MLKKMLEKRSAEDLLLIDGLGALVSAGLLLGVVRPFASFFGMPEQSAFNLGVVAVLISLFSLGSRFLLKRATPGLLRTIAVVNTAYVLLTLVVLISAAETVKAAGWLYFGGEMLIILVLARQEWSVGREMAG
jgi:hypothetical protein